ncbi:MAG: aspartate--ammonia ligase [Clostridia bacterium]|nr:aspartate--ammonia ligase [Clostridia bacterium]
MARTVIPEGYKPSLELYDTQKAISLIKRVFEDMLSGELHLRRVSAPLLVTGDSGLNDNLNGTERPVEFDIPYAATNAQIVHSLAKWKRQALAQYGFEPDTGLYTDMNAIRRDEELDNIHSIYVDQWDWEKVMADGQRNSEYLKQTVRDIVKAICLTQQTLMNVYDVLEYPINPDVKFITSQELLDMYPDLSAKERENEIVREHGTVFLMQIGGDLSNGKPHDGRAPDYDDWSLNGDLLLWNNVLGEAFEISSMGIRVDAEAMQRQLALRGRDNWANLPFHKQLIEGKLPQTIGGGIGQSRLCMLLLNKAHIGEVQVSIWDEATKDICANFGVPLL